MKTVSVNTKNKKLVALKGIDIDIHFVDSSIKRVILKDCDGGYLELEHNYGINVSVIAPPEYKTMWRLRGEVADIKVQEDFDSEYLAKNKFSKLEVAGATNLILKEEKVEVM